jgi:hypothetical protein
MAINATDFLAALEEIEASKGISKETILQFLEESLIKAYRKQLGGDDADVRAKIDPEKNKTRSEAVISADDSKVTVCVIPTNEEIMIARDTLDLVTTGKVRDN